MNTYKISQKFTDREDCVNYLEKLRWDKGVICPYCGSKDNLPIKGLRHHCNYCERSFSVFVGTIFEDTRMDLPKFFVLISLMLSNKAGISSSQLARDLDISLKSAWYCSMRVRCAMIETITDLHGIVEADESYIGGKPRKKVLNNIATLNKVETKQPKRGRGSDKVKVAGFIERDGRVSVKVLDKLTSQNLLSMLHNTVSEDNSILMTDDFKSYKSFDDYVERFVINHSSDGFVNGKIHVNTIEGFWGNLKSGLKHYKSLSPKYLPFYLAEFSYRYNRRNLPSLQFESFMKDALSESKCMEYYKPEKDPKQLVSEGSDKEPKTNVKKFNKANSLAGKKRRKNKNKSNEK